MPIIEKTFMVTNEYQGKKYGFAMEEYEGKFSIISCEQNEDGKIWPRWCYPQIGRGKASEKVVPMKIGLGDHNMTETASACLRLIADILDGEVPQSKDDGIQF
ncbi:MAG: hypothetical protein PVG39_02080 [Desulfobacteraceae bacterium]|jgi:hypothetical protein